MNGVKGDLQVNVAHTVYMEKLARWRGSPRHCFKKQSGDRANSATWHKFDVTTNKRRHIIFNKNWID